MVVGSAPGVEQPELRAGDIIVATNLGGQIVDVEKFQNAVRETTAGTTVRASVLRFNPATGGFDERESTLKTVPYPNQKGSRLGLVGEPGFVVSGIDPSAEQPELRVGDIIVATSVGGQLTNGERFQAAVRSLGVGSELRASILRFNPATGAYEERQVVLKTLSLSLGPVDV